MKKLALLTILAFLFASCQTINVSPAETANPAKPGAASATTSSGKSGPAGKTDDQKKSPFKAFTEVLKDTRAIDGFFKTHRKRDNTLYFEIRPEQIDQEFGLVMHLSRGVGVFNIHDGLYLSETRLMRFERQGDKIYLIHVNPRFTADAGSPMWTSLSENVGHSVVAAFDIAAQDSTSKAVLIDATPFLVSDYADVGGNLKFYFGRKPVPFDKSRSYLSGAKGFEKNVEIDVMLSFSGPESPTGSSAGVSDYRYIPVGVRYSLFTLPEVPMQPRLADERVGYFFDQMRDFSRDRDKTQYVRYINRWRLEKKDPNADRSEPIQPIVYYIDHSVPHEYRQYVKEGIEAWNKAFDAAGFINGIVAREAPADSNWSAEDIRYATVRWTAAHSMGYAIGPSQTDPRTGEILNADILLSSEFVSGWRSEYQRLTGPQPANELPSFDALPPHMRGRLCVAQSGKAQEMFFQHATLLALGEVDDNGLLPMEYLGEALRDLVMHEVGHTLGLMHNFKSSTAIPYDRLNDREFTARNGVAGSVMDYTATNISVDRSRQGHYANNEVGSYDVWAIQYGYAPMYAQSADGPLATRGSLVPSPEAELAGLRKIASRAAEPLLAFDNDAGAMFGVDPRSTTWDLSDDPVRFAMDRTRLVETIQPRLEARLVNQGESYAALRGGLVTLLSQRFRAVSPLVRVVGGVNTARDYKGDPSARLPYTPVPIEEQRKALGVIVDQMFTETAFSIAPDLLNKLAPDRMAVYTWAQDGGVSEDFPIHETILEYQSAVLSGLTDTARMRRMIDNEARVGSIRETLTLAEMMESLAGAIWSEIESVQRPRSVSSIRRNLQRAYLDRVTDILLDVRPSPTATPAPEDARSLARLELTELSARIEAALAAGSSLDRTTRAHLLESKARIDQALDRSLMKTVGG